MTSGKRILDQLEIDCGDIIYVHSSYTRLKNLGFSAEEILNELLSRVEPRGTVVFPSFSWNINPNARPWNGYDDYYHSNVVFDVINTKSNIGYLSELFRFRGGILRSAHPYWSVCAIGPMAKDITSNQEHVIDPYGSQSSFGIMKQNDVKVVGLGVTLNTTSLCPIVDFDLGKLHPQQVFTDHPVLANVILDNGEMLTIKTNTLLPSIVKNIKPSRVFELSSDLRNNMTFVEYEGSFFFSYRFIDYYESALALGCEAINSKNKVPWLENIPLKSEQRSA